ncbi:MAG: amidophosphoribosyltransferase [Kandleria vitulina]|uniref:amidophosphoribosyltransferase n=1 Tax=Kandleria vitulina TaxID=1630 RepID=UPI002E7623C4|nr:amidophosphoribosyltransferase [Kandleria vitulina]MEE0989661.1 amidophosphoribosyltransferase [Kandleria vitulina]
MGGFFGVASKNDCVFDLFFGTDYHSHLGTRRAGLAVYSKEDGFNRSIHNIENSPFRTKFSSEINDMSGHLGIGCISDYDPQPLIVRSHHGTYAIATVGKIDNLDELVDRLFEHKHMHFLEMSGGEINTVEVVTALINSRCNLIEGIRYAQESIKGSMTIMVLTHEGIYLARDKYGRTPIAIGKNDEGYCACFEAFAYLNLGYENYKELGPGEICIMTPEGVKTLVAPGDQMKICTFLWVYYGYPASRYEGVSVEEMRYRCGANLARRDQKESPVEIDTVAGVPDSGTAHAVGYANASGVPFSRPFIKYTPTWPRSFMPTIQKKRDMIAKMKLIPVHEMIEGKKILLLDDSIVRGTQLKEKVEFLYESGAKEVHVRSACPPIMFGCKYLNFSRSNSDLELIARRVICEEEGENIPMDVLYDYCDPDSDCYANMIEKIRVKQHYTSLRYNRLDDLLDSVGIDKDKLCTYCWNGKE